MSSTPPPSGLTYLPDPWSQRPIVGKFRVLNGVHSEGSVPGTYRKNTYGEIFSEPRIYHTNDVVASRGDLLRHNPIHGEQKFERVDDSTPDKYDAMERELAKAQAVAPSQPQSAPREPTPADDLESLTISQLRQTAAAEGIDLDADWKKQEIVDWIRQSRGATE